MKRGLFILRIHLAGFSLSCCGCGKELYLSEASQPNGYDGKQILKLAAEHECQMVIKPEPPR
jgi:hypothetical protein